MAAGKLDRRIKLQNFVAKRDLMGGQAEDCWQTICTVFAARLDISDKERFAAGEQSAELGTRWRVRSSEITRAIGAKNRILYHGAAFNISGVKETTAGRNRFIEITTAVRND